MRFLRFIGTREPRCEVPSREYMTETVLNKINMGITGGLMKKLYAASVEYLVLLQMVGVQNVATHYLLSLKAHWVDQKFTKMLSVLCVQKLENTHN